MIAYEESDETIASQCTEAGFSLIAKLRRGHNFALVVDRGALRVIAFRGTDEAADWKVNLNVLLTKMAWGWVHRGFSRATDELWGDVSILAAQARASGASVHITGHSLGGAIALLTAARMFVDAPKGDVRLVTFGQPAVGVSSFCACCDVILSGRYIRVVNQTDAVVDTTPLFCMHAGKLWYFDVDGQLHHEVSFRRSFFDHVLAPSRFGGLSQFTAHGMQNYVTLLEAQAVAEAAP